MFGWVSETG